MNIIDIGAFKGGVAAALSNFARHPFKFGGRRYASMEGFLQSLKFAQEKDQLFVAGLGGLAAKQIGHKAPDWRVSQRLHYKDQTLDRHGDGYQSLLNGAYQSMYDQSQRFVLALLDSRGSTLAHSIGKSDPRQTILTRDEFLHRLLYLRAGRNL